MPDRIERYKNFFIWSDESGPASVEAVSSKPYNQDELDMYVVQRLLVDLIDEIVALREKL